MILPSACGDDKEEDPTAAWVGHTYMLEAPEANWLEPTPQIGEPFAPFVPQFLMKVTGNVGSNLDVMFGTALAGAQDLCTPTTTVPATESYPSMQLGPADVMLHLKHIDDPIEVFATARNFTLKDVLPPRDMGEMTTTMDTRDIYPLVNNLPNVMPQTVCDAFEQNYMSPCEPCPHDASAFCITIKAIELAATESDIDLVPVDPAVVDDPACVKIPETP
jgi:hypothetical protein